MIKRIKISGFAKVLQWAFFVLGFGFLGAVLVFCVFYLASDHQQLVNWYVGLNGCFYHGSTWATSFFTPGIKSDGNMYCVLAVVVCITGWMYMHKRLRDKTVIQALYFSFDSADVLAIIPGLAFAAGLWFWGNGMAPPAYDEVFSAENAAGIHPFQCISYYMLPNNHLFFNLTNSLVFHFAADKVLTGRIISLLAYCMLVPVLYFAFKRVVQYRWLSFAITVTLLLQFPVWGFSFQARGYECYLVAQWVMVVSLFGYFISRCRTWLAVNTLSCAIGYHCIPSFLYLHAAQLLCAALYQLIYRHKDFAFWKAQVAAVLLTFLLYLPALCFSGLQMLTNNDYVASMSFFKDANEAALLQWMFATLTPKIAHIFSNASWRDISFNEVLYWLPLLLLINRKNKIYVLAGLFYICMWAAFLAIAIAMRRLPFERNLIAQYSISLGAVILVFYWLSGLVKGNFLNLKLAGMLILLAFFCINFARTNAGNLKDGLYEYNVDATYTSVTNGVKTIPAGSAAAFSDMAFYCRYLCSSKGVIIGKCANGKEQYFIKQSDEPLPKHVGANYTLINKFDQYEVFLHK